MPYPNDIALLKLSRKLKLGPKVFPACFPEGNMEFGPGDDCYITGWGQTGCKSFVIFFVEYGKAIALTKDSREITHARIS